MNEIYKISNFTSNSRMDGGDPIAEKWTTGTIIVTLYIMFSGFDGIKRVCPFHTLWVCTGYSLF